MQLYPALKAHMGDWTYYIVKMRMREVADQVKYSSEVHDDYTLNQVMQRTINDTRVKNEIVTYLQRHQERFFASLVVAAVGGSPKFFPVSVTDDYEIFEDEEGIEESFGVLKFSGKQNYYALDGQHRLKAIKTLLKPEGKSKRIEPPRDFENEEISVLMVIRPADSTEESWLGSYRRLFSSLNRYAKATDRDTNIIMDEDDTFAIMTRRLILEHDFFKASGRHLDSLRVKTKGKNLREGTSHFTSLQELYDFNKTLLTTPLRKNKGWGSGPEAEWVVRKDFKRFRPDDDYIDELFNELKLYWDAIIAVIPDLTSLKPKDARNHQAEGLDDKVADNALFWPIGQEVMISVARTLLNQRLPSPEEPTLEQVKEALNPLAKVDWRLHQVPWRGLLLVYASDPEKWSMRSDDRKKAIAMAQMLLRWITGIYQADERDEGGLKKKWKDLLGPLPESDRQDELWEKIRLKCLEVST